MPTTYRQLERPAQIDTSRFESGASAAAASLSRTLSGFADAGFGYAAEQSAKQGAAAGLQAAMTGKAPVRGLGTLTAYGKAYNNAALRSYAIKSEADADATAARLEVDAGNDPEKFKATFGAAMRGTLKEVPQEAAAVVQEAYQRRLSAGVTRLTGAQAVEQRNESRTDTSEGIARGTDRIAQLRASDNEADQIQADEEEVKLQLLIDGAELDGTLSKTEALSARLDSQRSVIKQTVSARFRQELENPYGNPVKFIQRLRDANKQNEALDPQEEAKLVDTLIADMQEQNALDASAARDRQSEIKARLEQGDRKATALLLSGQLNRRAILDMVNSQDLEPSVGRTLLNELENPAVPKDDPKVAFSARVNLLDYQESDLATLQGLTYQTRSELILKRREEVNGWKGTQAAREAKDRIDRALGIPEGAGLSGLLTGPKLTERELALSQFYDEIDALPPAERQSAVLRISGEVITRVIRNGAVKKLDSQRQAKARYIERAGDPAEMGAEKLKQYKNTIARYDGQILEYERQAGR